MKNIFAILAFSLLFIGCNRQKVENLKMEKVYLDKTDSTRNCYTIIYPNMSTWVGYVFILPGFGESAERVLEQTTLPIKAAQNGLLTIIPTLHDGVRSFGVDSLSQNTLLSIINDVKYKHKINDIPMYIGGYSIGGSASIKCAESAIIKPQAVFVIDSPLDFERLYYSAKRDIRLSVSNEPSQENLYIINKLEEITGGNPSNNLKNYNNISPYSFSDTAQTAIKKILTTPLRIYSEPDINWWLKERGFDLTQTNITECSAVINELNKLGNSKAVLITTQNKGYRKPDNLRHPHSWSIVDSDELVMWLLKQK